MYFIDISGIKMLTLNSLFYVWHFVSAKRNSKMSIYDGDFNKDFIYFAKLKAIFFIKRQQTLMNGIANYIPLFFIKMAFW